jgi:hypothetical protein
MKNVSIKLVVFCAFIICSSLLSAQAPSTSVNHLGLKAAPMIKRTESLYRAVETPQISKLSTGYLVTYTDKNYHAHLSFFDLDFQLIKDVRLSRSGVVKVSTAGNQIALLRCKYTFQKESTDPCYWEHNLFFETYDLDGKKKSSVKLVGDQYFVKGRKNRTYRSNYQSELIEHNGTYYASFEYQFNRTKKYDSKNHQLVQISPDNQVTVIRDLYKHVRQTELIVHDDTLYHVYTQSRGPRAILLAKYSISELSSAPVKRLEVGNKGEDFDRVFVISSKPTTLYVITDGTDDKAFLCGDDLIPVRIESVFISDSSLNIVLASMQDRKSYDILLVNYSLSGSEMKETAVAAQRRVHETSCYVRNVGSELQLVYKAIDQKREEETAHLLIYGMNAATSTEHPLTIDFARKPVFQFYPYSSSTGLSKLHIRDFRVNTRDYNHFNYNHLNTNDGMVLLNWSESGIDAIQIVMDKKQRRIGSVSRSEEVGGD